MPLLPETYRNEKMPSLEPCHPNYEQVLQRCRIQEEKCQAHLDMWKQIAPTYECDQSTINEVTGALYRNLLQAREATASTLRHMDEEAERNA